MKHWIWRDPILQQTRTFPNVSPRPPHLSPLPPSEQPISTALHGCRWHKPPLEELDLPADSPDGCNFYHVIRIDKAYIFDNCRPIWPIINCIGILSIIGWPISPIIHHYLSSNCIIDECCIMQLDALGGSVVGKTYHLEQLVRAEDLQLPGAKLGELWGGPLRFHDDPKIS